MTQSAAIGATPSTTQQIPVGSSPDATAPFSTQTTTLDGVPYLLTFMYSQREDRWYMQIATVDGDPIYGNVKLVCNWDLFGACVDARMPPGKFVVVSNSADDSPPAFGDLVAAGRCALMYVTAADLAALATPPPSAAAYAPLSSVGPVEGGGVAPSVLDGTQCLVPGLSVAESGSKGPTVLNCASSVSTPVTIGGDPSYTYTVVLRVRGIMQMSAPAGAATDAGAIGLNAASCVATSGGASSNAFTLAISAPAATYMLNAAAADADVVSPFDYVLTIGVQGGATVTLAAATSGQESANQGDGEGGASVALPGLSTVGAQPYDGQFVQLNVGIVR